MPALTVPLMHTLVEAGADVIELGVPFSDPMADGPTIQRASERALAKGMSCARCWNWSSPSVLPLMKTPVVLMGYANPIEAMGLEKFAAAAARPALMACWWSITRRKRPLSFGAAMKAQGMDPIFLLAPTSTAARIARSPKLPVATSITSRWPA
jgi:tryptophan synthase alpha chain